MRLPALFANALLALGELTAARQVQPRGAATAAAVTALRSAGDAPLRYVRAELKGDTAAPADAAAGADQKIEQWPVVGLSPSALVRLPAVERHLLSAVAPG